LVRLNTYRPLLLAPSTPQPHQGELRTNGLPTTSGGANEDVLVGRIKSLEDLRLDLVEVLDPLGVDRLELLVVEGSEGKGLEVEKGGRGRELLREDKMLEGNGEPRLGVEPSVRDKGDVVVGWDGFEHGDSDRDIMFVLGVSLAELEGIMEEDDLAVDVFNEDVERLGTTVDLGIPLEVGDDGEVDAKEGAGDGLYLSLQLKLGEGMHEAMDATAFLREAEEFTNFGRRKIEVAVPRLKELPASETRQPDNTRNDARIAFLQPSE
jgi:hypothetical protein